jgi:hypothetical protein
VFAFRGGAEVELKNRKDRLGFAAAGIPQKNFSS